MEPDRPEPRTRLALARARALAGLSGEAVEALAAVAVEVTVEAGRTVTVEGQPRVPVYFVADGAVRAYRTNADGREQTLAVLEAGDAFDVPPAFAEDGSAPASTVALAPTRLLRVEQAELRRAVAGNAELGLAFLRLVSTHQRRLVDLIHNVSLLSVRARLARILLDDAGRDPPRGCRTHEEIAARIGTVREVVSRTLAAFAREGLVRSDRSGVEVLDRAGLEDEAAG